MFFQIDRDVSFPLYQQVIEKIKTFIDRGDIKPGAHLPPTRTLAKKLGVSRTTIYQAYQELQALGYLQSRPGSYTIVQERMKEVGYNPQAHGLIRWDRVTTAQAEKIYRIFLDFSPEKSLPPGKGEKPVDFASLDPDPRLHPVKDFKRCVNLVLQKWGADALQYGKHQGYPPLCETIARRLRLHGISVSEKEILITNGAQQAIDLVIRMLGRPEKAVVVEAPTYANILPLLAFSAARVTAVPMRDDGMDLGVLEKVLARDDISFVYTIPNFQNPTGITTTHEHREKLLALCSRHKVPIVEDGFEEEMKYFGKVDLPIKSIDRDNIVIYLGTFSKALFPGLRIGWITADRECIQRLMAIKRFSDLSSGTFVQAVLHSFCQLGYYDLHLRRLHRIFRKRMETTLETMESCFPREVVWTRPVGGYTLWVEIPRKIEDEDLYEALLAFGVTVSPGSYYFPQKEASSHFRISIAGLNEDEIREGMRRLGRALFSLI